MDPTTEYLSDYACRLTYEDLSEEAVHQVKRTLVDALGCGAGAFDSEPPFHRTAHGVSSAGESSGTHPRHLAGDVYGSGGLREYGSYPLPRL